MRDDAHPPDTIQMEPLFILAPVAETLASAQGFRRTPLANRYYQEKWSWIAGTHAMRFQLLDTLSDADLRFSPGGKNSTLGALCRELGDVQYSYIQSIKEFHQHWDFHNPDPVMETSVARLKKWYDAMNGEMEATVAAFTDLDLAKTVDRGDGFVIPVEIQLDIYLQALLIFFGKAAVFLRAMGRDLPGQMVEWIG